MDKKRLNFSSMLHTPTNRHTRNTTLFSPSPVPPVFSFHGKASDFDDDLFTPSPAPPFFSFHGKASDFNDDLFTVTAKNKGDVGRVPDFKNKWKPDSVLADVGKPRRTWSKRSKLLIAFAIFVVIIVALCVYLAVAVVNGQDESGDSNADVDECTEFSGTCQNGGVCFGVTCQCAAGWTAETCTEDINECLENPCLNGGNCENTLGSFTCDCPPNWMGPRCEIDYNTECSNWTICEHGGTCNNTEGDSQCQCLSGWTGPTCNIDINECFPISPCLNNGICINLEGSYRCNCPPVFTGVNCESDIDECLSAACKFGGTCVNTVGSYLCQCPPGRSGKNCDGDNDECADNPCINGGTCYDIDGSYSCFCPPGWTGPNCEIDINECLENPCLNGGNCENTLGSFTCDCPPNWMGPQCEIDYNTECSNLTICEHGGTCNNTEGDSQCQCLSGWTGPTCNIDINECFPISPCLNNGICINLEGSYRCDCPPVFTGVNCESDIDECLSAACKFGGTCVNTVGSYLCQCPPGRSGKNCDGDNVCADNPCINGGTCYDIDGSYSCFCPPGWTGPNCEIDVDECSFSNPCFNGGTCINNEGSYTCHCPPDWTGENCQMDINECPNNPCLFGGTCFNTSGSYMCQCVAGRTGTNCEGDVNECLEVDICKNGGTCINTRGSYACNCSLEWTGKHCENGTESGPVVVQGIDNGELFFMCSFNISSTDNLLYKVRWYQNDVQMYVTDFADTLELQKLRLTETIFADNGTGFQLGTEISCDVLSYFQENSTLSSESNRSPGLFVGLQIMTPSLTFVCDDHISITARTIVLKQTIPLTCPGEDNCEINLKVFIPEDVEGQCPKIGFQGKTCAVKLSSEKEVGTNIEVMVTCPSDGQYMQNDGIYQVYFETTAASGIWANYTLDPINVHILPPDNQGIYGKRCESKNDPHMVSGDQTKYELQLHNHSPGTFILYRNQAMKAEVQATFAPCSSKILCNAGVAVKFGQDVYVISVSADTITFGYKACGDRLLRVQSSNEFEYKIFFPYGTYVQVGLSNRRRSLSYVYVQLSPDDYGDDDNGHKTSGLCGPVNDDQSDDYTGRNGGVQPVVEFIESWRVTDNTLNMLEDTFDMTTLESMDLNVCTCTDNHLSPDNITECDSNPAVECSRGNDVPQHDCPGLNSTDLLYELPVVRVPEEEKPQASDTVWTTDNATEYCNNFFSESELYAKCSEVPNARPSYSRDDCVLDIMLSGGTEWADVAKSNMMATCLEELDRNQTLSEPQYAGTSLAEDIQAIACPGDCSGSGTCVTGTCICNSGHGAADCSISTTGQIDITSLLNDGICDEHVTACDIAWVRGYPMLKSGQLVCPLEEFTESIVGTRESLTPTTVPGIFSTIIEAGCPLPTAAQSGYFYRGYKLAISNNNGETVSEEREVIIYNSACQEISTGTSGNADVNLMDDRCFVEGSCRYIWDENGNDDCYKCLPQLSKWSWTWIFHPGCPGKTAIVHGNPPHVETFDGKQYTTRKEGWFYLMFDPNGVYQIIGEFVKQNRRSYLNAVTINYGTHTYNLGQNLELKVDGNVEPTPYFTWEEIYIYKTAADDRLIAILGNWITTSWDGKNTTHISVPLSFGNNTHALCGTYNGNKTDDFTKPNGEVTDKKNIFVESWGQP